MLDEKIEIRVPNIFDLLGIGILTLWLCFAVWSPVFFMIYGLQLINLMMNKLILKKDIDPLDLIPYLPLLKWISKIYINAWKNPLILMEL